MTFEKLDTFFSCLCHEAFLFEFHSKHTQNCAFKQFNRFVYKFKNYNWTPDLPEILQLKVVLNSSNGSVVSDSGLAIITVNPQLHNKMVATIA